SNGRTIICTRLCCSKEKNHWCIYLVNGGNAVDAATGHIIAYTANAEIWGNDSNEQYLTDDIYTSGGVVTSNDDVYYTSVGVVSYMSVATDDQTDYTAAGVTPDVNFSVDDYLKNTYTSSTSTLRLYASPITNYDLDTPASSYDGGFLLAPAQVATTITMTNSAGDTKDYTLLQKLYPPVYLVTNSYGTTKTYNMNDYGVTDYACIFALNMWNYDDTNANYKWSNSWDVYSYYTSGVFTNGDIIMKRQLVPYLFTNYYINNSYSWTSDASTVNISGYSINGTTSNDIPVKQLKAIGGDQDADAIIGVVRNVSGYGDSWHWAEANVTFTITDKFGEVYTTVKNIEGT
ncbi:MAG: hypothetical protein R3Y15_06955, partial [Rikenellaceae bacterium]